MTLVTSIATYPSVPLMDGGNGNTWVTGTSFARPNDTTAYAVGDVVSDSSSTAAVLWFPNVGTSGQIIAAQLISEDGSKTADYELYLFDSAPADHLDNAQAAVLTGSMPYVVHRFTFLDAAKKLINIGSNYAHYEMDGGNRFQQGRGFVATIAGITGLLITRTVYTPTALAKMHIRLTVQGW